MKFICKKCGAEVYWFTDCNAKIQKLCSKCIRLYARRNGRKA